MGQLEKVVDQYLRMDTSYALMITGEWGVGKTFYYKNHLKSKIENTPVYGDETKKYRPILISLFGANSIEDIKSEVLLSIYPVLKDKRVKLVGGFARSLIKSLLHFKGLGEYYEYASEIDIDKSDWIKYQDLVLCFDDLERTSTGLNIEEFIGFVNSLVETENIKVLIIANDNKINKPHYADLKEKVIGNIIEFVANLPQSYDSLISDKFKSFPTYRDFLIDYKEYILGILTKRTNNLRILAFALSYFHKIFSEIDSSIFENDNLNHIKDQIIKDLLKFTLVISIEYKEGRISYKDRKELDSADLIIDLSSATLLYGNRNKEDIEVTYLQTIIKQFYTDGNFHFFSSVYNYITGGNIISYEELKIEIQEVYHIEHDKVLPQYEVFNRLSYGPCFSLSDEEYIELTKEMLSYADKGAYEINDCLSIFLFVSRFENPLKLDLNKLATRIISGMQKGKQRYTHSLYFNSHLGLDLNSNHPHISLLKRIKDAALDINRQIAKNEEQAGFKRIETLLNNDPNAFLEEILDKEKGYYSTPVLKHFSASRFFQLLNKGDNSFRWKFLLFLRNRYQDRPYQELVQEKAFLEQLKERVQKKIKPKNSNVTAFIYQEIDAELKSVIDKLYSI